MGGLTEKHGKKRGGKGRVFKLENGKEGEKEEGEYNERYAWWPPQNLIELKREKGTKKKGKKHKEAIKEFRPKCQVKTRQEERGEGVEYWPEWFQPFTHSKKKKPAEKNLRRHISGEC